MIEIALSTGTQSRSFLPLTVGQRRRPSLDDVAPTSCNRRRRAEPAPNPSGARSHRPLNASHSSAFVVPTSPKLTRPLLKSP